LRDCKELRKRSLVGAKGEPYKLVRKPEEFVQIIQKLEDNILEVEKKEVRVISIGFHKMTRLPTTP